MGCCGDSKAPRPEAPLKMKTSPSPKESRLYIVGNFTGEFALANGRVLGYVYPGALVRVTVEEGESDSRLISMSQHSLRAVQAMK